MIYQQTESCPNLGAVELREDGTLFSDIYGALTMSQMVQRGWYRRVDPQNRFFFLIQDVLKRSEGLSEHQKALTLEMGLRTLLEASTAFSERYFRHFKGGYYRLIAEAKHHETQSPIVVYEALDRPGEVWTRSALQFFGYVDAKPRFEEVSAEEIAASQNGSKAQ